MLCGFYECAQEHSSPVSDAACLGNLSTPHGQPGWPAALVSLSPEPPTAVGAALSQWTLPLPGGVSSVAPGFMARCLLAILLPSCAPPSGAPGPPGVGSPDLSNGGPCLVRRNEAVGTTGLSALALNPSSSAQSAAQEVEKVTVPFCQ